MPKRKKAGPKPEKGLDTHPGKRGRGRPPKIPTSWITGRAKNYRYALKETWPKLSGPLLAAKTKEEVIAAFDEHGQPYVSRFVPGFASDILALIRDPKFPKRPDARINFLADSLGGRSSVSFRTSRDICARERAKQRRTSPHHIIRHEYYVECSCGYKGPARDNACRKCGAGISIWFGSVLNPFPR